MLYFTNRLSVASSSCSPQYHCTVCHTAGKWYSQKKTKRIFDSR